MSASPGAVRGAVGGERGGRRNGECRPLPTELLGKKSEGQQVQRAQGRLPGDVSATKGDGRAGAGVLP